MDVLARELAGKGHWNFQMKSNVPIFSKKMYFPKLFKILKKNTFLKMLQIEKYSCFRGMLTNANNIHVKNYTFSKIVLKGKHVPIFENCSKIQKMLVFL